MSVIKEANSSTEEIGILRIRLQHIYNAYRTAYLNKLYYGHKLAITQKHNFAIEILIALGATGSSGGIAGLAIWGTIAGKFAWLAISAVAAIVSIVKPILQLGKQIEKYTKLYSGHTGIYLELKGLVEDIEVSRAIPRKLDDKYSSIRSLIKEFGGLDDPHQNEGLIRTLQARVNKEIPSERLWMP